MSTLTATPLPGLAAVQLSAAGLPAGPAVITRTDVNGSAPVRLLPAQEPITGSLLVTDYAETTTAGAEVLYVLDRDDPIVFDAPHRLPTGSLTAWCATYPDALALAQVCRAGRVLLFRQADHTGMDRFMRVTGSSLGPRDAGTAARRWSVRVDTLDVKAPATPLLSAAGWDFDDLRDAFPSFTAAAAGFATFNAMTVGP